MMFIFRWILYVILFIYSLWFFLPKEYIYFKGEEFLQKQNIVINEEEIKDENLGLDFKGLEVYFDSLKLVNIDNLNINSKLYRSNIRLINLEFDESLKDMVQGGISKLNIEHSIFNPMFVTLNGKSSLGEIEGKIDLVNRTILVELILNNNGKKQIRNLGKFFKLKDGRYLYENKY